MLLASRSVLGKNNIDGRVTCENRSLGELRNEETPSKEFAEERGKPSACNSNSLRFFYDCIIAPIVELLEGAELIIVPEGPLCWLFPC